MKTCSFILNIILLAGLILSDSPVFSQGKFELSAGVGYVDFGNLKIKVGNNFQVGFSQGFFPYNKGYLSSTGLEIYYHFVGKSIFTDQRIGYCMVGHDWTFDHTNRTDIDLDKYIYIRFGMTHNISKRIGFNFDLGIVYDYLGTTVFSIMTSANCSFFVRL